jgi:RNA polymerase-binding transcription factor DksA
MQSITVNPRDRLTDENDVASEVESAHREEGIAAVRRSLVGESRYECVVCAEPIAEARRALGGVIRCLDCQRIYEQRKKQFSK